MLRPALPVLAVAFVAAALVAACASAASPGGTGAPAQAEIVSREMAFVPTELKVPADQPFNLRLVNEDAAPHNVAIFGDSAATENLFTGELISSTSVIYSVSALSRGTYYFHCDLHPEMTGTLVAED